MSTAVGSLSTKDVKFNPQVREEELGRMTMIDREEEKITEEEEEENKLKGEREMDLGPLFSLKEQLEKDKVNFQLWLT